MVINRFHLNAMLPAKGRILTSLSFSKTQDRTRLNRLFFVVNILQGSVVTRFRCDEIFNDRFIANIQQILGVILSGIMTFVTINVSNILLFSIQICLVISQNYIICTEFMRLRKMESVNILCSFGFGVTSVVLKCILILIVLFGTEKQK